MTDIEKCTTYKRVGDKCTISCNLGLWEVSGKYGLPLMNEASHYFEQYKADGEYSEILGGENAADAFLNRLAKELDKC